jgi:predicted DNA-binding transcriptional regulator AlpA
MRSRSQSLGALPSRVIPLYGRDCLSVQQILQKSHTTIWRLTKRPDFPRIVEITAKTRGVFEHELAAWLESLATTFKLSTQSNRHDAPTQPRSV